jgi:hypothetical protein
MEESENNKILKNIRYKISNIEFLLWAFGSLFTIGIINPEAPIGFWNNVAFLIQYGLLWAFTLGKYLSN